VLGPHIFVCVSGGILNVCHHKAIYGGGSTLNTVHNLLVLFLHNFKVTHLDYLFLGQKSTANGVKTGAL
jgi:hypothetical protein